MATRNTVAIRPGRDGRNQNWVSRQRTFEATPMKLLRSRERHPAERCRPSQRSAPWVWLQPVEWAGRVPRGLFDMGVDHRRLQTAVSEQQLDGTDVRALGEQVGCKRVAQCMDAGVLADTGKLQPLFKRPLDRGL